MEMNWLEMVAALLGVVSVWFVIKRRIIAFPIGIAMAVLYTIVFYTEQYYAGMLLQVFFVGMQLWGWYQWKGGEQGKDKTVVVRCCLSRRDWLLSALVVAAATAAIGFSLRAWTDAQLPFLDATTTSLSLAGQWWMNRKQIEHWLIWMVTDALYVFQTAYAELYWSVGLYAILLVQAVAGYGSWKQQLKK
jgi:nicotinamide mononucleotide transporter